MQKQKKSSVNRRNFLKGAAAGAAAFVAKPAAAAAEPVAAAPAPVVMQAEGEGEGKPGSDFMVDVIKSLGIEVLFAMPGGSFGDLHESVINYANNEKPEFYTCMHEESSAAMACGYAKIEGKPALIAAHGTVGLQHASMNIYEAWCDRVPLIAMLGNPADAARRGGEIGWVHAVQDTCAMVRDYTKWDDNPMSLSHFAESTVRAYKIAMTPPYGPVAIVADQELQGTPVPRPAPRIPKLSVPTPPSGDIAAVAEAAKLLVAAENPVIVASRAVHSAAGLKLMVELAETLQCAVVDQHRRMNFPTHHPLNQTLRANPAGKPVTGAPINEADVVLGLETSDLFSTVRGARAKSTPAKVINISAGELFIGSNYQDFMRYTETDISMAADPEGTLPALIEACKKLITADRKRALDARGMKLADQQRQARERHKADAVYGWDASPISTARLAAEVWGQIRNEDYSLVTEAFWIREWPHRLWRMDNYYNYIGGSGAEAVGYTAGGALGAAVANRKYGRLTIAIQPDGDLMCAPGILWTAAHHKIPILYIMHNNRAYHQEVMGIQGVANRRNRGIDRIHIGTKIDNPFIDYAKLAQGMGVEAEGPIDNPNNLAAAIRRGIAAVKSGRPYLIDAVTQPR
jgi:thiamine pyrophosphate-dependent acetolactate synthase large subunit-like protein